MNKNYTDKELLSAYIDGELSLSEKKSIEDKIKSSLELQKELSDLKKLKELTSNSVDRISESPFFETRLFANLNTETSNRFSFKKWIPIGSLTIVTLALMAVLKFNPNLISNLIEEQKSNLAGFYKENLQPLLYAADLTNEDIFNFAVYQELPLDSSDQQMLKLGYDPAGTEYFEIKNASNISHSNNLKSFVTALDLNDAEIDMIDSIIGSYSDQLSSLVLVNDKNSVAINPNIWNTRKVILADILSFAKKHAGQNYSRILPTEVAGLDNNTIMKWVNDAKSVKANQYIFFTPDSIFEDDFVFDMEEFKVQMENVKDELAELNEQSNELKEFRINFDSAYGNHKRNLDKSKRYEISVNKDQIKVNVQGFVVDIPELNFPDFDSIAIIINEATRNHYSVYPPSPPVTVGKNNYNYNYNSVKPRRNKNSGVSLDSLMHQKNIENDLKNSNQKKQLQKQSTKTNSGFNFNDSLMLHQNQELKKEMDNLRKELQQFRNDLTKPSESDSVQSKKSKQRVNPVDIDEIEI
jgi:hypothetical protein